MTDIDLERVEKKVDLILKVLLDLNLPDVGYPYDYDYLCNYNEELALLYNLNVAKDKYKIQIPAIEELEETESKLRNLQEKYKAGNYLAKDKEDIKKQIDKLNIRYSLLCRFQENRKKIEKALKEVNNDVYNIQTYLELRKKVGLPEIRENGFKQENDLLNAEALINKLKKGYGPDSYDPEDH